MINFSYEGILYLLSKVIVFKREYINDKSNNFESPMKFVFL